MLEAAALIIALTAVLAWVNSRFIRMPTTIGVLTAALVLSLALVGLSRLGLNDLARQQRALLHSVDFTNVLMQGMLSLLLFAGAVHLDAKRLLRSARQISALAVLGTIASTLLVALGTRQVLALTGVALPLPYCFVFGALISPTDPVAVLAILKSARVPESLEVTLAGEALFNDGIGIVLFALVVAWTTQGAAPSVGAGTLLFLREALGGMAYGAAVGWLGYRMLRSIDDAHVQILVSVGLVLGGYELASQLHVSGPLGMVVAGLIVGGTGRAGALSESARAAFDTFWSVIDDLLNAVLFVLIGLEVVVIAFPAGWLGASVLVIGVILAARALTVGVPVALLNRWFALPLRSGRVLTWAGIRGGISVALAVSLPPGPERNIVVMLTYSVVVFSILAQGLTIGWLARRTFARPEGDAGIR